MPKAEPAASGAPEAGRPRLVVELRELDEIYSRFRLIFLLTNVLTMLLAIYVMANLLFPKEFSVPVFQRLQKIGLAVLLGGSVLLCIVQWLCLRKTTQTARRKIEELTYMDPLTGVYNYRFLDRRLDEELRIAKRFRTTLSVIYMDLDNFKRVNDECGHQFGSFVLSEFGNFLKVTSRVTDLIGRMGGDEFLIIMPNTTRDEAQIAAERIRERLAVRVFEQDTRKADSLKVSMGVASFPFDTQDKEGLIAGADQAMYRAKQAGGNRVCI